MSAKYHADKLRFEIEVPTDGLPNLIQNPSGELGTWGWESPVANTTLTIDPFWGVPIFRTTVAQACYFTSEFLPVQAGKYVSSRFNAVVASANTTIRVRYQWYNAAKTLLSSSVQSPHLEGDFSAKYGPTVQAPANTAFVKVRFDMYRSGGNPGANDYFTFNAAMVTWTDTGTPTTVRTNLVRNPSFEVNTSGWVADDATMTRTTAQASVGDYSVLVTPNGGAGQFGGIRTSIGANGIPVVVGRTYTLSGWARHLATGGTVGFEITWWTAAGAPVSSPYAPQHPGSTTGARFSNTETAPSGAARASLHVTSKNAAYVDAILFEESTTALDYFDGDTDDEPSVVYAWSGTAHNSASTRTTTGATFDYAEPNDWIDILGPTHEIKIERESLNVGTLSATILDANLDPANAGVVQPGKKVRIRSLLGSTWESVYSGRLTAATTSYVKAKGGSLNAKGAVRVEVSATDNITHLSNQGESRGVATIAEVPYLLEGKGAPWSVNGSGNQISSAQIVFTNDNASVLDQVSIARDTELGHAWVDRNNVMQVWNANEIDNTPSAEFTDEADPGALSYSDIDVSYSTEDVINEVTVNFLRYKPVAGETEEVPYGPYSDPESIAQWGARSATFTVGGASENPVAMAIYGQAILDANATPEVRCNSLLMPVRNAEELAAATLLDLYSAVGVVYEDRVDDTLRIQSIEHAITPGKWLVRYGFGGTGSVAAPTWTPSPPVTDVETTVASMMRAGNQTITTNASGQFTITHGLGATPVWGHAGINGSSAYFCNVVTLNATTVTFILVNRVSGAVPNTSVGVRWAVMT